MSSISPKVLITAGPTRAYLDDFRFLSNHSTGFLGYELARQCVRLGMQVTVIAGKCEAPFTKLKLKRLHQVETFDEMRAAVLKECRNQPDWAVFTAAVLDFVPAKRKAGKTKSNGSWELTLKPAPKIIDEVGRRFPKIQRIGFKLEAKNPGKKMALDFGQNELRRRKLQGLVLNYLPEVKKNSHSAMLFLENGEWEPLSSKQQIANVLVHIIGT